MHASESDALGDLNKCFAFGNSLIECAARKFDRVTFVNLQPLQQERLPEYQDVIHHSGKLSHDLVSIALSTLSGKALARDKNHSPTANDSRIIIFALKQYVPNRKGYWGLGDIVRGIVQTCDLASKHGFAFLVDVRHHPISKILEIHHHDYEAEVDASITTLRFSSSKELESLVKKNGMKVQCIFTNGHYTRKPRASEACRSVVRNTLFSLSTKSVKKSSYADVVHIRFGDEEMQGTSINERKRTQVFEKLRRLNRGCLVVSDSILVQREARSLGFNVQEHHPAHFGITESHNSLLGVIQDFMVLSEAIRIYYYTTYGWKSNFLLWAVELGQRGQIIPLMSL